MNRIPKPGEFYRDIENRLYQIITMAKHTETGEELVVYQALYGVYPIAAAPLLLFNRRVDETAHPRAEQEYWFEPVKFLAGKRAGNKDFLPEKEPEEYFDEEGDTFEDVSFEELTLKEPTFEELLERALAEDELAENISSEKELSEDELPPSSVTESERNGSTAIEWLEKFLDAESYEKQLEVLAQMRGKVGKRELDSICLVLGIPAFLGDEDSQILNIKKHLETRMRYDNRRLR